MIMNQLNRFILNALLLVVMLPSVTAHAVIPEPDNLLFGKVSLDGQQITAANTDVQLVLEYDGNEIASYTMGDFASAQNQYVLEVPIDSISDRNANALRVGDTLVIRFRQGASSIVAAEFNVAERGSTYKMDLVLKSTDIIIGSDPDAQDTDEDGISDVYEVANGLNPLSNLDAQLDTDGDGVINLNEYLNGSNITIDDNPPHLITPSDKTVSSSGLFTEVDLGEATAFDFKDGILTATANNTGPFSPGEHIVEWSVADLAGNTVTKTQLIRVIPQVSFHQDQYVAEGNVVTLTAELNELALNYPVTIPFTVSGTATGGPNYDDHDLADGDITIVGGLVGSVSFIVNDDGVADEGVESIVVNMGIPVNAVMGVKHVYTAHIVEGNIAPSVNLVSEQGGKNTKVIVTTGSVVTVTASIFDPNMADVHTYDWTQTDAALIDADGDAADGSFVIDPSTLAEGTYTVSLTVTDGVSASGNMDLFLQVVYTLPDLISIDTDGDGLFDDKEGFTDSDEDGIPDYLDPLSRNNLLQVNSSVVDHYLIETQMGLSLMLGYAAIDSGHSVPVVSAEEVNAVYGLSLTDSGFSGGLFDYRITGLSVAGGTASIVLPLLAEVGSDASYQQLDISASAYADFVENENNMLFSAAGSAGYCPSYDDVSYTPGLTAGDHCVSLMIEDGGPNDADGIANQVIVSLAGVRSNSSAGTSAGSGGEGGGAVGPLFVSLLFAIVAYLRRRRKTQTKYAFIRKNRG